jgi:homopolymeric O-antigen transport system ATP-binding protein
MSQAISAEHLGKKYILSHEGAQRYTALRDVIANQVKSAARTLRQPRVAREQYPAREEFWALKDVSFDVQQGDRVGIIGRNGAGKSTLLKILSRITEPTVGKVTITGRVASLLEVGTGFHPELTGRENTFLNGAILGMSKAEIRRKFDEIVAFAEVERFLDTPVKRYSSGMYVRLAFAIAAHLEPEILIVDEVLAVGDAQFQRKCLGKMEDVGKEGRTVLFVSHNMSAIQSLCTKAIRMESGAVAGQGSVSDQIGDYLRGAQSRTSIGSTTTVRCGPDVKVTRLELSPNPVESKQSIDFNLELRATRAVNINALVVLIYSALGERVAIVDLRREDARYRVSETTPFSIEGSIASLPLVEGDYSVGLYVDYGAFQGNVLGLVDLTVSGPAPTAGFAPFPPGVRGVVELDCRIVRHQP